MIALSTLLIGAASAVDVPEVTTVRAKSQGGPRFEAAVEYSTLAIFDPAFDLFSGFSETLAGGGLKVGYRVHDRVTVLASYHRASRGAEVTSLDSGDTPYDYGYGDEFAMVAAFSSDQFALGPRVDVGIADVLFPYVTAQALVVRGLGRLDEDPEVNNNLNQIRGAGLGAGVLGAGGLQVRVPRNAVVQLAVHLELGYGWVSPIELGDLGRVRPRGFATRGGLGVVF